MKILVTGGSGVRQGFLAAVCRDWEIEAEAAGASFAFASVYLSRTWGASKARTPCVSTCSIFASSRSTA